MAQSQDDQPGTHFSIREIAAHQEISKSSVQRMMKKKKLNSFSRMTTPQMTAGCRRRRTDRAGKLRTRFTKHHRQRLAFQDEKDFTLQVKANRRNNRVYGRGLKKNIAPSRLFHEGNKFTRKLMVSAVVTWKGVSKPYFVAEKNIKVNGRAYLQHVKKDLLPFLDSLYPRKDYHFIQDSAPSHRYGEVQKFLTKKLKKRFVKNTEWPPSSPDCNPLDYFFWNDVQEKVYEGRHCNPFNDEDELKRRILKVWPECTKNLKPLRKAIKQFLLRLREVENKQGGSIKTAFG